MGRWPVSVGSSMMVGAVIVAAGVIRMAPVGANAQVVFHDIASTALVNPSAIVRDVTRSGGTIYAVGTSRNPATGAADAVLWTQTGPDAFSETSLPNFAAGPAQVNAEAITPDGLTIAAQARTAGPPVAARIAMPGLNLLNLNAAPYTVFFTPTAARAISDDGQVLYGNVIASVPVTVIGGSPSVQNRNRNRAARFEIATGTSGLINPVAAVADSTNISVVQQVEQRAASANGSIVLGWNVHVQNQPGQPALAPDDQTWRFTKTAGGSSVTNIPRLPGGTWNRPLALSNDGALATLAGNSTHNPNGVVYLYDATTSTLTDLGTPNAAWGVHPNAAFAGMTNDGSVIAVTFTDPAVAVGDSGYGYFHNGNGWFHLTAAMRAAGVDLAGWEHLVIYGMSGDATLVWGSGKHNGVQEGFIAEFAANYLETFDVVAAAPVDRSIVGVWAQNQSGPPNPANPDGVVAFMADGSYYNIEPDGFERGFYSFDGIHVSAVTKVDTNGDSGLSDGNSSSLVSISITGDTLTIVNDPGCPACAGQTLTRVTGSTADLIGGWLAGDPLHDDNSAVVVFTSSGKYFMAQDGDSRPGTGDPSGQDGIEIGTFAIGAGGVVTSTQTIDTNGQWGLSHPIGTFIITVSSDGLAFSAADDADSTTVTRILDLLTVTPAITSPLTSAGAVTLPFKYTIAATQGSFAFDATDLPPGLTVTAGTGVIAGTPTAAGDYDVQLSASNTLATGTALLHITIAPPNTATGSGVTSNPVVPPGSASLGLTFTTVTGAGETTVNAIDPTDPSAIPPPTGFTLGDSPIYYEIETTASFTGPVEVCFNYTGIDIGGGTPRLFHYMGGTWVDITSRVDTVNSILCGTTTSFSPFAIFVSPVTRGGFYSPVTSTPGFVNVIKGGSTVPLKFNVWVDGAAQTDTAGLVFTASAVSCSNPASGTPILFQTSGGTSLRYDTIAGSFVQNWKSPTAPGCYSVQMTTTADGLSLRALFRVK